MTDIVDRLRRPHSIRSNRHARAMLDIELKNEAASEIERLRAKLDELEGDADQVGMDRDLCA